MCRALEPTAVRQAVGSALQAVARTLARKWPVNRETQRPQAREPAARLRLSRLRLARSRRASSFEFCENGAKAVAWEATPKRTPISTSSPPHPVSELWTWCDFDLEDGGRLTIHLTMMRPRIASSPSRGRRLSPVSVRNSRPPDPNMRRVLYLWPHSNEAAFLYQLFVREFGTNNFPTAPTCATRRQGVSLPRIHRRRQGHGHARGLRQCRCHLLYRP